MVPQTSPESDSHTSKSSMYTKSVYAYTPAYITEQMPGYNEEVEHRGPDNSTANSGE